MKESLEKSDSRTGKNFRKKTLEEIIEMVDTRFYDGFEGEAELFFLSDKNKMELCTDSRFREFNFGSFEGGLVEDMWSFMAKTKGMTLEEMNKADFSPCWVADTVAQLDRERGTAKNNWAAEDFQTVIARLMADLTEVAEEESKKGSKNVLIVSHGMSIVSLIHTLAPDYVMLRNGLRNASITKISYQEGQFQVLTVNELEHIEAGKKEAN